MSTTADIERLVRCVRCTGRLSCGGTAWTSEGVDGEYPAAVCEDCGSRYPICDGVPVLFADDRRIHAVLSQRTRAGRVADVKRKMARAVELASDGLEDLKEEDALLDALGWEMYFWEEWKEEDDGVVLFDKTKIDAYLEHDVEGGGRLAFLERVSGLAGGLSGKVLLNLGAGRDLLLERFLHERCYVVEVDVVLEPLMYLHRRGADLCVCCDARTLPFNDGAFDITTSFGTLHHIWPIEEPITEMTRVTRGHMHVNEPNSYALTRLALRLPSGLRNRLKRWYTRDHSRSPYEGCISPRAFARAVRETSGELIHLAFPRSSWLTQEATGLRRVLRATNLMLVRALPFTSSHFDAVVRCARPRVSRP